MGFALGVYHTNFLSPPTRAEWIEMPVSVSRSPFNRSPPTRAEWIEIILTLLIIDTRLVSAHTGGVD